MDKILRKKLRDKWQSRYKKVSKQNHIATIHKIMAARIISKWLNYKRLGTVRNPGPSKLMTMKEDKRKSIHLPNISKISSPKNQIKEFRDSSSSSDSSNPGYKSPNEGSVDFSNNENS